MNMRLAPDQYFNMRAQEACWPVQCDAALAFDNAELRALHGAWLATAAGRPAPMRTDFTARMLGRLLRQLTFIEREVDDAGARRYRFRFFGSALSPLNGDLTGRYLDEIVPEPHLQSWLAAYDLVLSSLTPLRFKSCYNLPALEHLRAESYAAPLLGADGRAAGLLTASIFAPR
jgi:hypothetical protein